MKEHSIKIEKTAHYYSIGELNKQTNELWIVCHGYGQLAYFFIDKFKELNKDNRYIVAPEVLNKFYLHGFDGRVGANWMTKEKRLDEINDYCLFIEQITDTIKEKANPKCKIISLGFSQGTSTISRWLLRTKYKIDSLILWGGKIANDFDFKNYKQKHPKTKNFIIFGTKDQFYSMDNINEYRKKTSFDNVKWINYSGGHTIDEQTLKKLVHEID